MSVAVLLDNVGRSNLRIIRVGARITFGLPLPQKIPALIERHLEILQPSGLVLAGDLAALASGAQVLFLGDQIGDVGVNGLVGVGHESTVTARDESASAFLPGSRPVHGVSDAAEEPSNRVEFIGGKLSGDGQDPIDQRAEERPAELSGFATHRDGDLPPIGVVTGALHKTCRFHAVHQRGGRGAADAEVCRQPSRRRLLARPLAIEECDERAYIGCVHPVAGSEVPAVEFDGDNYATQIVNQPHRIVRTVAGVCAT